METIVEKAGESGTLQPGQRIKPNVSVSKAKELVESYYDLKVESIRELNSYDDNNFYVKATTKSGSLEKFTFKVLNSMDTNKPGHVEAEHEVMHLLAKSGFNCPTPYKNIHGKDFTVITVQTSDKDVDNNDRKSSESSHLIRLLTFVEGKILYDVPCTPKLLQKTGKFVAEIERAMKAFRSPNLDSHTSIWMMSSVLQLEKFLYVVEDSKSLAIVTEVLDSYRNLVLPLYPKLKRGVLHGDLNEQNIIVTSSPTPDGEHDIHGVIDFGDLHVDPYVFQLALTLCYMMLECSKEDVDIDPFVGAQNVLKGYSSVRKLDDDEVKVLQTMIASRLCQSLVLGAYTYSLDPGNEYLLTTAKTGWGLLERVWREKSDQEILALWKEAINSSS